MKILRPLVLSSLVLALTFTGLPVQDALARLSRRAVVTAHRRGNHRYCRHSRAWWKRRRARIRERQERAMLLRRRRRQAALEAARARSLETVPTFQLKAAPAVRFARALPLTGVLPAPAPVDAARPSLPASFAVRPSLTTDIAPPPRPTAATTNTARTPAATNVVRATNVTSTPVTAARTPAGARTAAIESAPVVEPTFRKARAPRTEPAGPRRPFDFAIPQTWRLSGANARGEMRFAVAGRDGRAAGTATLAPVSLAGPSAALDVVTPRTKLIGGIALPVLRRTIIDRMLVEGGWVTNDLEREIDGRRVYVVTAQTGQGGVARQSWTFYFTELEGRLYSLATNAPVEFSAPLAVGSEQLLATLRAGGGRGGSLAAKPQR